MGVDVIEKPVERFLEFRLKGRMTVEALRFFEKEVLPQATNGTEQDTFGETVSSLWDTVENFVAYVGDLPPAPIFQMIRDQCFDLHKTIREIKRRELLTDEEGRILRNVDTHVWGWMVDAVNLASAPWIPEDSPAAVESAV
jgi:hypothetical protein